MVRLVLFDIDGTLVRTGGAGMRAFARACELEFQVRNGMEHLSFAGRTDPSILREFFTHNGIDPCPANFTRFYDCYVFLLEQILQERPGRVLPGVSKLLMELKSLSQPPLLGLLTGNILLGAQIKLRHYGLWERFETGAFGDDHEDRNEIAHTALERGRQLLRPLLSGDEVVVIGDTPRDVACGRHIGARVLAVATGPHGVSELQTHRPTWVVENLEEITAQDLCR
jgi:phosphoglycolate phosphatase-like HAD superfamily hydrolase